MWLHHLPNISPKKTHKKTSANQSVSLCLSDIASRWFYTCAGLPEGNCGLYLWEFYEAAGGDFININAIASILVLLYCEQSVTVSVACDVVLHSRPISSAADKQVDKELWHSWLQSQELSLWQPKHRLAARIAFPWKEKLQSTTSHNQWLGWKRQSEKV